ncbi:MAG: hypothetical protein H7338_23045 [Candidatus Sericytochromatia bacterium]|nr:hypothetical protein [Candidatus Sericytochromatia bacterium]
MTLTAIGPGKDHAAAALANLEAQLADLYAERAQALPPGMTLIGLRLALDQLEAQLHDLYAERADSAGSDGQVALHNLEQQLISIYAEKAESGDLQAEVASLRTSQSNLEQQLISLYEERCHTGFRPGVLPIGPKPCPTDLSFLVTGDEGAFDLALPDGLDHAVSAVARHLAAFQRTAHQLWGYQDILAKARRLHGNEPPETLLVFSRLLAETSHQTQANDTGPQVVSALIAQLQLDRAMLGQCVDLLSRLNLPLPGHH